MLIARKADLQSSYTVFGVFWIRARGTLLRSYSVIEQSDEFSGFSYFDEEQAQILDHSLDHYTVVENYFDSDRRFHKDLLVHNAAGPASELYEALANHDDYGNVQKLLDNMLTLGVVAHLGNNTLQESV